MYNIHLLPAGFGDSILIEYGKEDDPRYVLIDGGPYFEFDKVLKGMFDVAPNLKKLELLVVTHIDIDHIDGIVKLFRTNPMAVEVEDIWFNGYNELPKDDLMGPLQGEYLSLLIEEKGLNQNKHFGGKRIVLGDEKIEKTLDGGMKITLLGPDLKDLVKLRKAWEKYLDKKDLGIGDKQAFEERFGLDKRYKEEALDDLLGDMDVESLALSTVKEDKSAANGSSIAFIAEYDDKRCLFSGDAQSPRLKHSLEKFNLLNTDGQLPVDAWKLSHHGSKKSTQDYLMKMIHCDKILISSDGKRYKHPDAETIAKLISIKDHDLALYFNYHSEYSKIWDDDDLKDTHSYETHYPPEDQAGISLKL